VVYARLRETNDVGGIMDIATSLTNRPGPVTSDAPNDKPVRDHFRATYPKGAGGPYTSGIHSIDFWLEEDTEPDDLGYVYGFTSSRGGDEIAVNLSVAHYVVLVKD
jgi:hypothetical protein